MYARGYCSDSVRERSPMKITARGSQVPPQHRILARAGQLLGAALTAAMGWVHLHLWLAGYRDIPLIGTLFLLNAVIAAILVTALAAVPAQFRTLITAIAAIFTAGTLASLILSLTISLFGVHESLQTPLVPTTIIIESTGTLVLTLTTILGTYTPNPKQSSRHISHMI